MPDRELMEQLDQAIEAILAGAVPATAADPELTALVEIAAGLRDLPSEDFKTRLESELERRASMTPSTVAPIRAGFRTVTPYITVPDAAGLIEFVKKTFGAEELLRQHGPAGGLHAEIRIGDSVLMIGGGEAARGRERPGAFHVYVEDCDAVYRRAIEAGGVSMGEPTDHHYGERAGFVKDAFGNDWYIATHLGPSPPLEAVASVTPFLRAAHAPDLIEFLGRALGAIPLARYEDSGRTVYAAVRIGDAVLEMSDTYGEAKPMPSGFYMYVEDADAVYRRAIDAGATSLWPPTDQPYGDRTAGVRDPFGYQWFPATRLATTGPR